MTRSTVLRCAVRHSSAWACVCFSWWLGCCAAIAQINDRAASPSQAAPQPKSAPSAGPASTEPSITVRVASGDMRRFQPGKWSPMKIIATNHGDQADELYVAGYFQGRSDLQFGRRMWLPPQATRTTWLPVYTPDELTGRRAEFMSFLLDPQSATDIVQRPKDTALQQSMPLNLDEETGKIGLIVESDPSIGLENDFLADPVLPNWSEVAIDANDKFGKGADLFEEFLPPLPEMLEQLDSVILQADRVADDAAGLLALRQWVERGGRLWIVLNNVSLNTVQALLGSAVDLREVDRISLERLQFTAATDVAGESQGEERIFDPPVEMIRVLTDAKDIPLRVNGWPAAICTPLGAGEVVITTVEAPAWATRRSAQDAPSTRRTIFGGIPAPESFWVATPALREIARRWLEPREADVRDQIDLQTPLSDQIGYRIPSRWAVVTVLAVFCSVLLAAGWRLSATGRLEYLAWVVPLSALPAAGLLLAWGAAIQQEMPATIASLQWLRTVPEAEEMQVRGSAVFYRSSAGQALIGGGGMGLYQPDLRDTQQSPKRIVWSDLDQWSWNNLLLPRGLRTARFESSLATPQPTRAVATFGREGLEGELFRGPLATLDDWLLLGPTGPNAAVRFTQHRFFIGADDVLASGQFLQDVVLSDVQRSRAAVVQEISERRVRLAKEPVLLAWTAEVPLGFQLPENARREGSGLVIIPIELQPPPPESDVWIPAPWIRFRGSSTVFNQRQGNWIGPVTNASRTELRCELPRAVLPLTVSEAGVTLKIRAPSRKLTLTMNNVPIDTQENPIGELNWTVRDPQALQLSDSGALNLVVEISGVLTAGADVLSPDIENSWKIDDLQLHVRGRTHAVAP